MNEVEIRTYRKKWCHKYCEYRNKQIYYCNLFKVRLSDFIWTKDSHIKYISKNDYRCPECLAAEVEMDWKMIKEKYLKAYKENEAKI